MRRRTQSAAGPSFACVVGLILAAVAGPAAAQHEDPDKARKLRHGAVMVEAWTAIAEAKSAAAGDADSYLEVAQRALQLARRLQPDDYRAVQLLGTVWQLRGQYERALAHFGKAEELIAARPPEAPDPGVAQMCWDQAWIHLNGFHDRSDRRARPSPEHEAAALDAVTRGLALFESELQRVSAGSGGAAKAAQLRKANAELYELLFHTRLDLLLRVPGHEAEARVAFGKAVRQNPRDYRLVLTYGDLCAPVDERVAIKLYAHAIKLEPKRYEAHGKLGRLHFQAAKRLLERATRADGEAAAELRAAAAERLTAALTELDTVYQQRSWDTDTLRALVEICELLGEREAHAHYAEALQALEAPPAPAGETGGPGKGSGG